MADEYEILSLRPAEIVESLTGQFEGLVSKASWGETSLFFNPDLALTNGVYFCTIKEHDGANDKASALDRPGVFRLALGLPAECYERICGARPTRPPKGSVVATGHDFAQLDVVMPHPIYAWMGWIQVLNPSDETFASMQPLFVESYDLVLRKYERALGRNRRYSRQRVLSAKVAKHNGGVPPFGFPRPLRVFIDPNLLQDDEVWDVAAHGTTCSPFTPNNLVRASGGVLTDLKRG